MSNPTITIHFSGPKSGQVEFEGFIPSQYEPLVLHPDTGAPIIPAFCGLRITKVESFAWYNNGQLVETLPNYEDFYQYLVNLDDAENTGDFYYSTYYLGGIWFTGPIGKCAPQNKPWYFPIPFIYENSNPTAIADKLVIQTFSGIVHFLEYSVNQPKPLKDPFSDIPEPKDFCKQWPDFCKEEDLKKYICSAWPELCENDQNDDNDDDNGNSLAGVLGGASSFSVSPPVGPPIPPGYNTTYLQRQFSGINYFFQPVYQKFKILRNLIRENTDSPFCTTANGFIKSQIKEVKQELNVILGLVKESGYLLETSLKRRQEFRQSYGRNIYSAYHKVLTCTKNSFLEFLHLYHSFHKWEKMNNSKQTQVRLETIQKEFDTLQHLFIQATLTLSHLNDIIWPLENNDRVVKIKYPK